LYVFTDYLYKEGTKMEIKFDNITLKTSTLEELEKLNFIHKEACEFLSFDLKHDITEPYIYITDGALPPNGVRKNFEMLSCYVDNNLCGYLNYYRGYPEKNILYISFIYLINEIKHKGIGKKIINYLSEYFKIEGYKYVRLSVSLKNWEGLRFWHKCGFERIILADCSGSLFNNDYGCLELEKML